MTHTLAADAQSVAGADPKVAMQLFMQGGLQLALFAAIVKLAGKADTIQKELNELVLRQAVIDACNEELRARTDAMEVQVEEAKARAEAQLASLEAKVEVHYALQMQLADTRIRELLAEVAMLRAMLDAKDE